jgi:sugar lactone lactonase YvrE
MNRPLRALALAAAFSVSAAACGGSAAPQPSARGSSVSPVASSSAPSWPAVPNPFTAIATYSANSLSLKTPISAGIAVGPDGNLYVADSSQRITVVSPQGKVLRRIGTAGTRPGQFHFISYDRTDPTQLNAGLAVREDGDVYVVDSGNNRVEVFSPQGRFIRAFGTAGAGQLLEPNDVAVDQAGDAFVTDVSGMTKFSPTGAFVWAIGGTLASDPDLAGPLHLADVDVHGRVVTAAEEARGGKVLYIDEAGHKVDSFAVGGLPPGVGVCNATVDPTGDTIAEDCGAPQNTLFVYDRSHRLVGAWPDCHLLSSPRFGPNGGLYALRDDGTILELKMALPGA